MTARSRATTDRVLTQLRADVLGGVHPPGSKLKFADLGERYQASVSVIREALARLVEQGLVDSVPRVGFRVAALSDDDLFDLTETRISIESMALRLAIEHGDLDWESTCIAAHHRLERTVMQADAEPGRISDDWEAAHGCFHAELLAGCGRPRLLGIARTLRESAELYRRWSHSREPGRDVAAEHREILELTVQRDADAAVAALTAHYRHTAEIIAEVLIESSRA